MKLIYLLFVVLLIPLVIAVPPQELSAVEGLTLEVINVESSPINTSIKIHVHAYDTKTGMPVFNTLANCNYHLYYEETSFSHVNRGTFTIDGFDYESVINETNLSRAGDYSLLVWCNTSTLGGFKQSMFNVYEKNENSVQVWTCPADGKTWHIYLIIGVALLMIILAFVMQENLIGIFGGIILTASYLFVGACAPFILLPLAIAGLLITVKFAIF